MVLLYLAGMNVFEAVCHALTALATGGFSTRTLNVEAFHSPLIEAVLVAFMVIGAVNFHVHLQLAEGRLREALGSVELRAMLALIAAATAFVAVELAVNLHYSPLHVLRLAAFQVASISTTTGYTSMNVNLLPPASKWLLICLMVVGGSLCSTAGGVKVARAVVLVKLAKLEALRTILPRRAVARLKVGGGRLRRRTRLGSPCSSSLT